jgi:quercetin 2,3-dioxygenase
VTRVQTVGVSGPVRSVDVPGEPEPGAAHRAPIEVTRSRAADVGGVTVRRALPRRERRTVGAWCFADHMGPHPVRPGDGVDIGPHPHTSLQTVTWLTSGELLHRDSLGSEQTIRPGQLNLMTAGRGVSHAEESTAGFAGEMQGIQLWVAQPEATRHGEPAFEHHAELPTVEIDSGAGGRASATVLVGTFAGEESPARRDTPLVGVDLVLRGGDVGVGLDVGFEHALVVLEGAVVIGGHTTGPDDRVDSSGEPVGPGHLVYLGPGHDELGLEPVGPTRVLLLGGEPFESPILMWWNFVGRSRDEIDEATRDWEAGAERFGETGSPLGRIPAPPTPW